MGKKKKTKSCSVTQASVICNVKAGRGAGGVGGGLVKAAQQRQQLPSAVPDASKKIEVKKENISLFFPTIRRRL